MKIKIYHTAGLKRPLKIVRAIIIEGELRIWVVEERSINKKKKPSLSYKGVQKEQEQIRFL